MIHLAIALLSLAGFAALLLAMARHQADWLGRKLTLPASRRWRAAGFGLLALAFASAACGLGWAYGAVCWFGWLTIAAGIIVALHPCREELSRRVRP